MDEEDNINHCKVPPVLPAGPPHHDGLRIILGSQKELEHGITSARGGRLISPRSSRSPNDVSQRLETEDKDFSAERRAAQSTTSK